jgi:hypothetical protein
VSADEAYGVLNNLKDYLSESQEAASYSNYVRNQKALKRGYVNENTYEEYYNKIVGSSPLQNSPEETSQQPTEDTGTTINTSLTPHKMTGNSLSKL